MKHGRQRGLLIGLTLLVLLIACANVANLLLAVAVGRRQEAVIQLALGATRKRLVVEFLKESALLCAASAVLGYVIAAAAIARYGTFTMELPIIGAFSVGLNLHLDWTVAVLTIALMLIAIVATGLAPALYASNPNLGQILSGEIVVGGTRRNVRRNTLVIVQVSVCTLVLIGMGLCQRGLYNLRHVDPGFSARNLVAVSFYPKHETSEAENKTTLQKLRDAVAAVPGVEATTLALNLPLFGSGMAAVQFPEPGKSIRVAQTVVDSDYFLDLRHQRLKLPDEVFNSSDREGSPEVIVINHKMAEMFWPVQDPLGRTVVAGEPGRRAMVVGVVADGKYEDLDEAAQPFFYYPLSQHFQAAVNVKSRGRGSDPHLWVQPLARCCIRSAYGVIVR